MNKVFQISIVMLANESINAIIFAKNVEATNSLLRILNIEDKDLTDYDLSFRQYTTDTLSVLVESITEKEFRTID